MLREKHVNKESKSLELTIYLYRCYEHEDPSSCNTTVYLSWLLHLEDIMGENFHTWWVHTCEHDNGGRCNVRKHREINNDEKYITLDISLEFGSTYKI